MRYRWSILMTVMILSVIALGGCGQNSDSSGDTPTVTTISSFYPVHTTIERIEMLSAAGHKKSITSPDLIKQWQEKVGEILVTLNPSPKEHSGSLYAVTLIANGQVVFRFTPTFINGTAIVTNSELANCMTELWNEQRE